MKNRLLLLLAIVLLQACSAPRYTYFFDHQTYQLVNKPTVPIQEVNPLAIDHQALVASTGISPSLSTGVAQKSEPNDFVNVPTGKGTERRTLRFALRREFKGMTVSEKKQARELAAAKGGMDKDLKLAAIFGSVGIVGLIIGGSVFNIIGGIAMLIGLVFFVRWLLRQ